MTTVQLFGDIGLYSNYKQIINFSSVSAQNTWFNSKTKKTISNVIYNKVYNSLKLNMSYGEAIQYSYVRLLDLDNTGRIYYNFVSAVNLIDDATVEFILEPDVIQTYMTYWSLKESMVNRAHVDRWSTSSNKPIRITPNKEGIDASYSVESYNEFMEHIPTIASEIITFNECIQFVYIIIKGEYALQLYFAPVLIGATSSLGWNVGRVLYHGDKSDRFPELSDIVSNDILRGTDPESVICMGICPFSPLDFTVGEAEFDTPNYYYNVNFDLPDSSQSFYAELGGKVFVYMNLGELSDVMIDKFKISVLDVNAIIPIKPSDNSDASDTFEPALYMAPYRYRNISTASASMNFDIPDISIVEDEKISFVSMYGLSAQSILTVYGIDLDGFAGGTWLQADAISDSYNIGLSSISMMDSIDVFNNPWTTYMLTQRDSDRQIINNNAISSVLQGLLFGSYGGALVTSRGTGGTDKRSLAKMATRMGPGIALGGLASAGAAIIDSHYAWENQLLEERKIQNKAQQISISGTNGAQNASFGISIPRFNVLKCDDANYQRAYDNFRKYGYMINQFTELDINSRKYYNYVMTNGAVIGGAIPENVRDIIASIFDSGVTIFHGDYCDTLTYPTKENIERSLMT